jgi:hypothetical protein
MTLVLTRRIFHFAATVAVIGGTATASGCGGSSDQVHGPDFRDTRVLERTVLSRELRDGQNVRAVACLDSSWEGIETYYSQDEGAANGAFVRKGGPGNYDAYEDTYLPYLCWEYLEGEVAYGSKNMGSEHWAFAVGVTPDGTASEYLQPR